MKKLCPSCGCLLGPKHAARHAKYVIAHRRAVRKLQRKYAEEGKQCYICGGKKIVHYAGKCDRCGVTARRGVRRRMGCNVWTSVSGGRKPFVPDESFPLTKRSGAVK